MKSQNCRDRYSGGIRGREVERSAEGPERDCLKLRSGTGPVPLSLVSKD